MPTLAPLTTYSAPKPEPTSCCGRSWQWVRQSGWQKVSFVVAGAILFLPVAAIVFVAMAAFDGLRFLFSGCPQPKRVAALTPAPPHASLVTGLLPAAVLPPRPRAGSLANLPREQAVGLLLETQLLAQEASLALSEGLTSLKGFLSEAQQEGGFSDEHLQQFVLLVLGAAESAMTHSAIHGLGAEFGVQSKEVIMARALIQGSQSERDAQASQLSQTFGPIIKSFVKDAAHTGALVAFLTLIIKPYIAIKILATLARLEKEELPGYTPEEAATFKHKLKAFSLEVLRQRKTLYDEAKTYLIDNIEKQQATPEAEAILNQLLALAYSIICGSEAESHEVFSQPHVKADIDEAIGIYLASLPSQLRRQNDEHLLRALDLDAVSTFFSSNIQQALVLATQVARLASTELVEAMLALKLPELFHRVVGDLFGLVDAFSSAHEDPDLVRLQLQATDELWAQEILNLLAAMNDKGVFPNSFISQNLVEPILQKFFPHLLHASAGALSSKRLGTELAAQAHSVFANKMFVYLSDPHTVHHLLMAQVASADPETFAAFNGQASVQKLVHEGFKTTLNRVAHFRLYLEFVTKDSSSFVRGAVIEGLSHHYQLIQNPLVMSLLCMRLWQHCIHALLMPSQPGMLPATSLLSTVGSEALEHWAQSLSQVARKKEGLFSKAAVTNSLLSMLQRTPGQGLIGEKLRTSLEELFPYFLLESTALSWLQALVGCCEANTATKNLWSQRLVWLKAQMPAYSEVAI